MLAGKNFDVFKKIQKKNGKVQQNPGIQFFKKSWEFENWKVK